MRSLQAASSRAPRSTASRKCASAGSGIRKGGSVGQPRFCFVSRTSSTPSGEPCASKLSCLCGDPKPMCVRTRIRLGRARSTRAACSARSIAGRSLPSETTSVCQPYAAKRRARSSENVIGVAPARVTELSSYRQISFPRRRCPASDAASAATPSIRSPSPASTYVAWSITSWPGRL